MKPDGGASGNEEETLKTSLEFEISEQAPEEKELKFTVDADITPKRPEIKVEVLSSHKDEPAEPPKEEFSVPDSYEIDRKSVV